MESWKRVSTSFQDVPKHDFRQTKYSGWDQCRRLEESPLSLRLVLQDDLPFEERLSVLKLRLWDRLLNRRCFCQRTSKLLNGNLRHKNIAKALRVCRFEGGPNF